MHHVSAHGRRALKRAASMAGFALAALLSHDVVWGAHAPIDLGAAGNCSILAKSGISTIPPSRVTGDVGVSPIASTGVTGFSLMLDGLGRFATSTQVVGEVYAPDFASPTPVSLSAAVGDMLTGYIDAAGRMLPDHTELGAGNIGGMTLAPGLYKWATGVTIPADVTLSGGPDDVWIFQIAGNLAVAGAKSVLLDGGAKASNVFWQVAGGVGVNLGSTSHFEGIILSKAGINLLTGASINGRLLAQTAVTLDGNTVTAPPSEGLLLLSAASVMGSYRSAAGQIVDSVQKTVTVPRSGTTRFYRIRAGTTLTLRSISVIDANVVIAYH